LDVEPISPTDLIGVIFQSDVFFKSSKKKGRPDILVELYYNGFQKVMIIEVKIEKIEHGDDESISAAHERNLVKAREQVGLYIWKDSTENVIQRVVVSGVWHPRLMELENFIPYKLNSVYEFL
jgi:hypothetical protein